MNIAKDPPGDPQTEKQSGRYRLRQYLDAIVKDAGASYSDLMVKNDIDQTIEIKSVSCACTT